MEIYFALILVFVGLLWWFNGARQKRLDADPGQQELARVAKGSADRRVRQTHAVMLVRSEAAPDLYEKVLELSRKL